MMFDCLCVDLWQKVDVGMKVRTRFKSSVVRQPPAAMFRVMFGAQAFEGQKSAEHRPRLRPSDAELMACIAKLTNAFVPAMPRSSLPLTRRRAPVRALRSTAFFVAFVCLALFATNAWLVLRERDEALRDATIADTNLTQAMAQQIDSVFSETTRILDTIAFEMDRADKDPTTLARMQRVLVTYAAASEQIHSLFVFDRDGNRVVSSEAMPSSGPGAVTREYFSYHRDSLSLVKYVGRPIVSRLSGIWLVPVSRRLDDPDGKFAGVVLATIAVQSLQQLLAEYQIGQQGALTLAREDGTILVRRPFDATDIGKSTAGSSQFALIKKSQSGNVEAVSSIDGVERLLSYQHLKDNPLVVTVALSKREVLQHWRTTAYIQTGWILLLCGFVGVMGSAVIHSVQERFKVEHTLRLARDDLTLANTQLTYLARFDGLTSLANRRHFDERLAREFAQCTRTHRPLALIMIDVDHFKLYNDTYGHPEGDKCLQAVAHAIKSAVHRPHDLVARYGGEEMAVLLPETGLTAAAAVAQDIRAAVALLVLPFATSPAGYVSISAGVAEHGYRVPQASALALLTAADGALYQAKRNGRNRVSTGV